MMRQTAKRWIRRMPYVGLAWRSRDRALNDLADCQAALRDHQHALTNYQEALSACEESLQQHREALDACHRDFAAHRAATEGRLEQADYNSDGLITFGRSLDFLTDPRFRRAYERGMNSGQRLAGAVDADVGIEYRVHMILWAAAHAFRLDGDFVECGVNTGMYSLALCDYFDWNSRGRHLWLFDTYCGIPEAMIDDRERELGRSEHNARAYSECYERACANFRPFANVHLVRGEVPGTLPAFTGRRVAYLSIDMNVVAPEIAAIEFFWDRLAPSAVVVLDDYGWADYRPQKEAMDDFARRRGVMIATLPTGQGLILR